MPNAPRPVIDRAANMVSLAKQWLMALDRSAADTSIPTPTLELMLNTLVEWGEPEGARRVELTAQEIHEQHKAQVAAAFEDQQDDNRAFAAKRY